MSLRNIYILDFHNPVNVSGCLLRVHCYSKIQEKICYSSQECELAIYDNYYFLTNEK